MKRFISAAALMCITLVFLLEPLSLAWLSDNGLSSPINIESNVHKSYFESGDGTKEIVRNDKGEIISGPYEIAHPVQLYYFAWLQYLGYFNRNNDDDPEIDCVYFRLSQNLDMKEDGLQYILPPVGSQDNPFVGNFDGEGHTIKNLIVQNFDTGITESPTEDPITGVEVIGFFGVIGALKEDYSYESSENEIKNFVLENITVKTQTQNALIGLIAGYVNGNVDRVGVVGSTVDIKAGTTPLSYTQNISDYSLIGYCTEDFKKELVCVDLDMLSPDTNKYEVVPDNTSGGDGQGWGGSIAMNDMFTFLQDTMDSISTNKNYIYAKTVAFDLKGNSSTLSTKKTERKALYDENLGAAFVFSAKTSGSYSDQYTYLSGGSRITEYTYNYSDTNVAQYYIADGAYYLNFNGTRISSTTNQANATKWYVSEGTSGGLIYTVINDTVYHLTVQNNAIATPSDAEADYASLQPWSITDAGLVLNGRLLRCNNGTWTLATATGYLISNGSSHYLAANGTSGTTDENTATDATKWTITTSGSTATISTVINGATYYIGASAQNSTNATLTLRNSKTNWTYDATNNRFSIRLWSGRQYYTYYLVYDGSWKGSTTEAGVTLEPFYNITGGNIKDSRSTAKKIVISTREYIENTIVKNGNTIQSGVTYFPLSVNKSGNTYTTAVGNTGYIISNSYSTETTSTDKTLGTGDIRVSYYDTDDYLKSYTTPYAISYKTKKNGNYAFQTISTTTAEQYGLLKFNDCYDEYTSSIGTYCYGLHFMQASIDINSTVTAGKVQIIGETYSDYQMPTNCIDFNLAEQGFINFVAGTYFSKNDSFFSLQKIERDKDRNITAIKEIDKIYGYIKSDGNLDPNKPYYYTYTNAESDAGMPSGTDASGGSYQIVFDTQWITDPNSYGHDIGGNQKNYTYYFEVPVYAGEYALGSAGDEKIGAYLIYLDLAANAQVIERTRVDEKTVTVESAVALPNGVSMLEKNDAGYTTDSITAQNSAFAAIGNGFSGSASFSQSGTTIQDSAQGHTATYVSDTVTLIDGNGNPMTVPITKTVTVEKTTYHDINLVTKAETVTVIVKTSETVGQTTTIKYTKDVTKTATDGTVTQEPTKESQTELLPDTPDPETNPPVVQIGKKLIDITYLTTDTSKFAFETSYTPEGTNENGQATAPVYTITVTNTTGESVDLYAVLTAEGLSSGITFVITDGTSTKTLDASAEKQMFSVAVSATS